MEILACFGEVSVTVESHVTPLRIGDIGGWCGGGGGHVKWLCLKGN